CATPRCRRQKGRWQTAQRRPSRGEKAPPHLAQMNSTISASTAPSSLRVYCYRRAAPLATSPPPPCAWRSAGPPDARLAAELGVRSLPPLGVQAGHADEAARGASTSAWRRGGGVIGQRGGGHKTHFPQCRSSTAA